MSSETDSAATVEPSVGARPATTILSWKHPNPKQGEQEEPLCAEHLEAVRESLSTLGIGCIGWEPDKGTLPLCVRCGKQLPWRYYLFPSPPIYTTQRCPTCGDTYTSEVRRRHRRRPDSTHGSGPRAGSTT